MHPSFSPSYRPRGGYRQLGSSSLYFNDGSKIPGARIDARPRAARMMGGDEGQLSSRGQFWGNPDFRPAASMPEQPKGRWVPGNSAGSQVFIPEGKNDPLGRKEFNPPPTPAAATTTSTAPTAPATTATTPATKPEVMGPPKPAVFEGKSRAEWFGAAAKRQGQGNAYSNDALAQSKPSKPSTPPTYAPGSIEARSQALGNAMKTAQQGNQIVASLPKPAAAPMAKPSATSPKPSPVATNAPATPAAPSSDASWFSNASKSLTQGAQTMMNDRAAKMQKLADLENRAKPGTTKIVEGATDAAKTVGKAINEGIPKVANTITTGMEDTAKAAIAKAKEVTAPARTWLTGDKNAADEAAKLKAQLNPTAPKPYVPTYTGGDNPPMSAAAMPAEDKKKRVAAK